MKHRPMDISDLTWDVVLRSALASYEEHVIKLVWTCWRQNKEQKDPVYMMAAGQKAGLIRKAQKNLWWPWAVASAAIVGGLFKYRKGQQI